MPTSFPVDQTQNLTITASGSAARRRPVSGSLALTFTLAEGLPGVANPRGIGAQVLGLRGAGIGAVRLPASVPAGSVRRAIATGYSGEYPAHFCVQPGGIILIANGIDPMLRWDGVSPTASAAGVEAPVSAPTLSLDGYASNAIQNGDQTLYLAADAYYAAVRYVDDDGVVSDLSPLGGPFTAYLPSTWTYTAVPEPTGSRASRRQLLRTTSGQAATFYVDLEVSAHAGPGPFVSKNSDGSLLASEAVPLFDDLGNLAANIHGVPPSWKAIVVAHLGRLFAAVEVAYTEGHVGVVAGSKTASGVGTHWPANLVGRVLRVAATPRAYAIAAVDIAAQTLTLEDPYAGATDPFAAYAIRPPDVERKLVYYTAAGEVEGWPPTYALEVQEDGDDLTGLMSLSSFLFILEREHVYRFTFKDDPATDGVVFLSTNRGCLTDRLWTLAEDVAYMLDQRGVHAFDGGQSTPVSEPIQDLFRVDSDSPLRINWAADPRFWHASWSGTHGVARFFVSLAGSRYPRHALCFHPRLRRWWIEEYTRPVCSSIQARLAGVQRVLVGTDHREVVALDDRPGDGPRDPSGSLLGTVTAATPLSLTDARATFAADVVNCPVWTVAGRGKGQWRRVTAASATRLDVDRPWTVLPDSTTTYAVGGVGWRWTSGYFRYSDVEPSTPRDVEVLFTPAASGSLEVALFNDHDDTPLEWAADRDGLVTVAAGDRSAVVDLATPRGQALFRLAGHRERNVVAATQVSVGLSGVQAVVPVVVHRLTVRGAEGG